MQSCRNAYFKVRSHYSNHVVFHAIRGGASRKKETIPEMENEKGAKLVILGNFEKGPFAI